MTTRLRHLLLGRPRDLHDPRTYDRISLIAFLAWVGLGADGLSSSAYGPEEGFKALGEHTYLAVGLALAIAVTVFIISYAYSRIVEQFPYGGGGYIVATRLLGERFGVLSGCALLVDYVLTITVSIAAGADAAFSFLPPAWHPIKFPLEFAALGLLMLLNLRGVRESVTALAPVFVLFVVTHAVLIFGTIGSHAAVVPETFAEVRHGFENGASSLGVLGMLALLLHAYAMGAGTYTGIEAVSNGLPMMREPRVRTARRTMLYMALSLAITASGLTLAYLLVHAAPTAGKTMNAVLAERFAGSLGSFGQPFVVITLAAEAALLLVAAQAGFLDGPRVMANMAIDSWLPRRFAQLSDRLTVQQGILLISGAACCSLLYAGGDTSTLVLMYAINVFVTFSLSEWGMVRHWLAHRRSHKDWHRHIVIHAIGLVLCLTILAINVHEKFSHGGWITLLVTGLLVVLCLRIRRHYRRVQDSLKRLDEVMAELPAEPDARPQAVDPSRPTAVLLVGGYGGLGIHALLSLLRVFPGQYRNFLFVSVGVINSATSHGIDAVAEVRRRTEADLESYVGLAKRLGLSAGYRLAIGTETVAELDKLCRAIAVEFAHPVFFAGKLIFERERWFQRLLHNQTAYQIQRRLQFAGMHAMVLPVRVIEGADGR